MAKVVYNDCYGGFTLSQAAVQRYRELTGILLYPHCSEHSRHDPVLVQVVEELGIAASGRFASLSIREIPNGAKYRIDEYDGNESVMLIDEYEWVVAA